MDRWDWMAVRAYMPSALALVISALATWLLSGWRGNPYLAPLLAAGLWVPLAALAFAAGHGAWVTYRLWRADRGEGVLCACGGLLGAERAGRYGRYRQCLACSRNVAHRHYE